jgi:hypothetical protein
MFLVSNKNDGTIFRRWGAPLKKITRFFSKETSLDNIKREG